MSDNPLDDLTPQEAWRAILAGTKASPDEILAAARRVSSFRKTLRDFTEDDFMYGLLQALIDAEIILSMDEGYDLDVSAMAEMVGLSRTTVRNRWKQYEVEYPGGPRLINKGGRTVMDRQPAPAETLELWDRIVEIMK